MSWVWPAAAFGFALVDWYYVAKDRYGWRALTKPIVILALLLGFTLGGGWQGRTQWFGFGLLCCLVGDIFMILPSSFFPGAFFSFLPVFILYSFGFIQGTTYPKEGSAILIVGAVILAIADTFGFNELSKALGRKPKRGWLRIPFGIYLLGMSLMLISAIYSLQQPNLDTMAGLLYMPGAVLLFVSDFLLAYNRFVSPIRSGRLIVTITYHMGQIALITGVMVRG